MQNSRPANQTRAGRSNLVAAALRCGLQQKTNLDSEIGIRLILSLERERETPFESLIHVVYQPSGKTLIIVVGHVRTLTEPPVPPQELS